MVKDPRAGAVRANAVTNSGAVRTRQRKKPRLCPADGAAPPACVAASLSSPESLRKRLCRDHQRDPPHCGSSQRSASSGERATARAEPRGAAARSDRSPEGLTGKAWLTAADIALSLVVAEGWRQAGDAPVVAGPGELHAVTPGEAGAALALPDVLLAAGARVACGEPEEKAAGSCAVRSRQPQNTVVTALPLLDALGFRLCHLLEDFLCFLEVRAFPCSSPPGLGSRILPWLMCIS